MKIWLLTVGEPVPVADSGNPRLLRTGVLARHLAQRGHNVTWWTSTFDHNLKKHRTDGDAAIDWNGVSIRMLHSVGYGANVSLRRFVDHAGVARKFRRAAAKEVKPDVILASLPTIELAREAVRYGCSSGVPVLVDVRDLWPDVLFDLLTPWLRPVGKFALHWLMRDATYTLRQCVGVVGISQSYLAWALRYAGRSECATDGLFPLGYFAPSPQSGDFKAAERKLLGLGVDPGCTICWYVGSFGRQYDLDPVIFTARQFFLEERKDIQFVISGDGDQATRWRRSAIGLDNVVFTGWITADEINWLRLHSAIGLQPYADGAPQGLANKLFEYLSAGMPVISSLRGENEKLIEAHQCGVTYRAGDAQDFQCKLISLLYAPEARRQMGQRGLDLFRTHFDASTVFDGLADHIETVARTQSAHSMKMLQGGGF